MHVKQTKNHPSSKRSTMRGLMLGGFFVLAATATFGILLQLNGEPVREPMPVAAIENTVSPEEESQSTNTPQSDLKETQPTEPSNLSIKAANVQTASVVSVDIETNGDMEAPATNHEVGWYNKSAVPSDAGGAVVLNGHVGYGNQTAIFKNLSQLKTKDIIELQTGDGMVYEYEVYQVEQQSLEDIDMRKVMRSVDPTKQGLNIITCAGDYNQADRTYSDRTLVYAVRL